MNRRTMLENLLSEQEPAPIIPYLTFSNSIGSFTIAKRSGGSNDGTLEYSTDAETWNIWNGSTITSVLNNGIYYIYLRGSNNTYIKGYTTSQTAYSFFNFGGDTNVNCSGNIETLLDYQTALNYNHPIMASNCYAYLFYGCTYLAFDIELPATTLTSGCYKYMFEGCMNLIKAPKLPAITLADNCYYGMFYFCSKLTTIPKLPATTLVTGCYQQMFRSCSSLYVSDTQTAEAPYAWRIPTRGTFTNTISQSNMFAYCLGTRASDAMPGQSGQSYTYYTQNPPVGD